nr:MAG: hypothetical protein [Microvirus sp.]
MGKLLDKLKKLVARPDDAKYHLDGLEYPDPREVEVPLKLIRKHQDMRAYIQQYVQSEVVLAKLRGEHETLEEAMDFADPEDREEFTAAQMEAEELEQMARDDYQLRRAKKMVDMDRQWKSRRPKAAAAPLNGEGSTPPAPSPQPAPKADTPT